MVGFLLYAVVVIIMFNANIAVTNYNKSNAMKIACFLFALAWPLELLSGVYCIIKKKGR